MAEVTNFEHNGVSVETTESPEAMGGLGDNVVGLVGTAPKADMSVPRSYPFRINSFTLAALLDPTGTEAGSLYHTVHAILKVVKVPIYVVIEEEGATPADTVNAIIGGVDATSGQVTGLGALALCAEVPTIIGAPGFSDKQAVHSELASLGKRIRARVVFDGLDTDVAGQVVNSQAIGGAALGYDRCYMVHQMPAVYSKAAKANVFLPPSSLAIAAMAAVKQWESPGNQVTYAADVARTVEYNILDKSTEGDLLNRYGVSYYARTTLGGFSLLGNRSITGKFISYVGLEDAITRKLVKAAQKVMAKNLTKTFMEQEVKRIDDWIQTLVADETIPGGKVYLHPELNSVEKYKNGTWYLCIDYGRYAPNEHMIYQLNASDAIIEEFLEDVL
ncbi:phage tail protein [Aquipseudomonas alcaligenes]|uniref:Phage tail protein n=1 Tax=Aquipseudomonas alcaligenes TaxID=43263 RepID=A0A2V4KDH2_AQUAC|nr:phage tail protein [Pseudomonas alcaligenes]PYC19551.1 phage tail protein [Pseudomonas alcaligenes]